MRNFPALPQSQRVETALSPTRPPSCRTQLSEQLAGRFKQGLGSHNRTVNEDKVFTHERAKLEKRCHGFESRLNALETYNARLAGVIDALRKQNAPRRQAMKRVRRFINIDLLPCY